MNLNDFFIQLYESEKRAKQRKQQLSEIQQEIKETEIKIKETRDEEMSLKGQLAVKLQSLSEEEINCKWIRNKESTMKGQLNELKNKTEYQATKKHKIWKECSQNREEFMVQVRSFVSSFGLSCNGQKIRDLQASKNLESLRNDKEMLLKELQQLRDKQRQFEDIKEKKTAIENEVSAYRKSLQDLEKSLESSKKKTQEIIKEKHQQAKKPENSQEFRRLQQELEVYRRDSLEGLCQALQPEVDRLQRQVWQKKIQGPTAVLPTTKKKVFTPKFMPQRKSHCCRTAVGYREIGNPVKIESESTHECSSGSKIAQSNKWNKNKITSPSASADTEEFERADHLKVPDNDNNETEIDLTEEVSISDDEELPVIDLSSESSRPTHDNSIPERAKRVRFE